MISTKGHPIQIKIKIKEYKLIHHIEWCNKDRPHTQSGIKRNFFLQDNYNTFHLAVLHSREDVIRFLLARRIDITILAGV